MKHRVISLLLLLLGTCSAAAYRNVALRGKATQSSRYADFFSAASNAIDGNRDSNHGLSSCSHTAQQTNPWWRVDLLESYTVTSVIITNRGDCCAERIEGAQIHISNSLEGNGASNPLVGTIPAIAAGETYTVTVSGRVDGRYVTVYLPGSEKYLTLCEVEVYGYRTPTGGSNAVLTANTHKVTQEEEEDAEEREGTFLQPEICTSTASVHCSVSTYSFKKRENLAIQGKASQSSLFGFGPPYNAIDGYHDGNWIKATCSHTNNDVNPWWRLVLPGPTKVFSVKVTNRVDYWERLNGAEIRIGDSLENNGNNNPRCALITSIPPGATHDFDCNGGMEGHYVNIFIPGRAEFLSLCEVEVYGSFLDPL